jgi:formyltetrahydrofolate-dependent phosphoribosylglycinamide formyltransferase
VTVSVAVFASGGGSNLQALLDHFERDPRPARVALVVCDRPDAGALERAHAAGVPARVILVAGRSPDDVAGQTLDALEEADIGLVALAGYLKLVPRAVIARWRGRILNIHPALLPSFGGKGMYGHHVHRAVIDAGCLVSGATVHLVDERYDEGRPLVQWPVPVLRGDTPDTLAARVLRVEHVLYPLAVEMAARAVAAGSDVAAYFHARLGGRAWGFAAPLGSFEWNGEEALPGLALRKLFGLELEERP